MHSRSLVLLLALSLAITGVRAAETGAVFRSGPARVALFELYTSEGCSSCPPAEKWLGELRQEKGLWRDFVPVAFHVNYWDHLGWRDALASKAFTDREYAYAAAWRSSSVYTPCFVRNGEEWRPRGNALEANKGSTGDAGTLTLTWLAAERACTIEFTPARGAGSAKATTSAAFEVSVALLGGDIVTNVRKGENSGRELRHEFVALRMETLSLARTEAGTFTAKVTLPARPEIKAPRQAVAAWVTKRGSLAALQATGGWLP